MLGCDVVRVGVAVRDLWSDVKNSKLVNSTDLLPPGEVPAGEAGRAAGRVRGVAGPAPTRPHGAPHHAMVGWNLKHHPRPEILTKTCVSPLHSFSLPRSIFALLGSCH